MRDVARIFSKLDRAEYHRNNGINGATSPFRSNEGEYDHDKYQNKKDRQGNQRGKSTMKPRDIAIINNLRRHSRASMTELANSTGIPLPTVFKSLVSMQKEGIIYRYVSLIDFAEAGYPFRMAFLIKSED
jgi:DNA-binding Lrp family transcriptional regulator